MKVAFVTAGQPRFTPNFTDLVTQVKGVDSVDLYSVFWKTEWADNDATAREKLSKILPSNWNISVCKVVNEPNYVLPEVPISLEEPSPENILWWYKRCFSQCHGLYLASQYVPDTYDMVARFRVDCSFDRELDFSTLHPTKEIIIPNNPGMGWPDMPFTDQFFVGKYDPMMKLLSLGDPTQFPSYVQLSDSQWYANPHGTWRGEWLFGTFLKHNNMPVSKGDFAIQMNTYGRSKFTDKHYHHNVASDPTE